MGVVYEAEDLSLKRQRDGGLGDSKGDLLLRNIEKDQRYVPFLKKMNLPLD